MDIKGLQYFVTSVDTGNFHTAAEVLITSQPNVSKVIKALELELDMVLLKRDRNGVSVTADGEIIYRYAMNVLNEYKVIHEIKNSRRQKRLLICGTLGYELAPFVAEFCQLKKDADLQMECHEERIEKVIIQIHRREFDIGFVYILQKNMASFQSQINSKGLEYCELARTSLYLYAGEKNAYYNRKKITAQEIEKIQLIQYAEERYSLYNQLLYLKGNSVYGANKPPIIYTNSDHFLIQLLKSTNYGSIGSSFLENKYQPFGVHALPIAGAAESVSCGYLKRCKGAFSPIAHEFITFLKKRIARK